MKPPTHKTHTKSTHTVQSKDEALDLPAEGSSGSVASNRRSNLRIVPSNLRIFAATWNVGGKSPHSGLNLDNFLQIHDQSDIYVLGFQEIVPLNAGNVLAIEINGSAAKWLSLICQSLNKTPYDDSTTNTHATLDSRPSKPGNIKSVTVNSGSVFSQKVSLRSASRIYMAERMRRIKSCNCIPESERKYSKDSCFKCQQSDIDYNGFSEEEDESSNVYLSLIVLYIDI